jgi:hypothetical protein
VSRKKISKIPPHPSFLLKGEGVEISSSLDKRIRMAVHLVFALPLLEERIEERCLIRSCK